MEASDAICQASPFQAPQTIASASTTSMNLEGTSTDSVFWFEPKDVQELVNETLKESLEKLTADTKVEKRALRPR